VSNILHKKHIGVWVGRGEQSAHAASDFFAFASALCSIIHRCVVSSLIDVAPVKKLGRQSVYVAMSSLHFCL